MDSLGGNSKTIIIANISPSNCCSLETLSSLKLAQRAKFIRNNTIMNEDAPGDVLAMRLQIQQLKATQRTEEVQGLKMRLLFRKEGIKSLEAINRGKQSAETHLLQEKEELMKEIESLRNQVDRNPEITRFAMENLHLKEELRRLQSFVEEGKREMLHGQLTVLQDKLLEALDWKLMHEKDVEVAKDRLSLTWGSSANEENEFLHLQAIQHQREVEDLRKNLTFCLEAKEKLERRVDELVSQLEEQRRTSLAIPLKKY